MGDQNSNSEPSLVRLFFGLLQCIHHTIILQHQIEGNLTKAFKSKINHLNQFIRPALPDPQIKSKILNTNKTWVNQITQVLLDHYKDRLSGIKTTILSQNLLASDISLATNQAINRGKKSFGKRLSNQAIQQFKSLTSNVLQSLPMVNSPNTNNITNTSTTTPIRSTTHTPNITLTDDGPTVFVQGAQDPLSNFYPCNFYYKGIQFSSVEHAYQYHKALTFGRNDLLSQILHAPRAANAKSLGKPLRSHQWDRNKGKFMYQLLIQKYNQVPHFRNKLQLCSGYKIVHNVPDNFWGWGHDQKSGQNIFGVLLGNLLTHMSSNTHQRPQPSPKSKSKTDFQTISKHRHHTKPTPKLNTSLTLTNRFSAFSSTCSSSSTSPSSSSSEPITTPKPHPQRSANSTATPPATPLQTPSNSVPFPSLSEGEASPKSSITNLSQSSNLPIPFSLTPVSVDRDTSNLSSNTSNLSSNSSDITPNRHENLPNKQKISGWDLPEIEQPILIVGTSQLSNIKRSPNSNIQIESYPGAQIRHIEAVIRRHKLKTEPKHLIVEIGINDRDNSVYGTTFPNLKKMIATIRSKFPHTKIYIPAIQFSRKLDLKSQENLNELNQIFNSLDTICCIPPMARGFKTSNDNIHWTNKTANALLKHWINHLN